ncbi:glycolipid transfer protein [Xylona heveae TC161]|uniref:Glycolipid transfer protein n=1 Tax=Xylona heveae (strain CBS 132557 / TC161) TaxID=1328760 RepID=A0A165HDF5_XYLHT|nr:glycolipid transfer protein [Xylona heveae TC161]KZF23341.1 glycolipid transfer protein [Xylona heveae TC161]
MSAPQIPPGGTFFDTIKESFADVPVDAANDDAISTEQFLEAADALATLFDLLASVVFVPVKQDIQGNVKKLRDRFLAAPTDSQSIQALVVNEIKSKQHTATEGLLWLVRGLDFTAQALRLNLSNPSEELATSFKNAYATTLKPHHNFIVKAIFNTAMSATPTRADFYKKLGDDQTKVDTELRKWLSALERQVAILKAFQQRKEAKW